MSEVSPAVVIINIGMNDLCTGRAPEDLAKGVMSFAHKLGTLLSVLQVQDMSALSVLPGNTRILFELLKCCDDLMLYF